MKAAILPLEGEDLQRGADRLRTLVYAEHPAAHDVEWHRSVWSWLGSNPLAHDMRRWVVATADGRVVGHLAAVPQLYRVGGRRVVAHTPADYQALPGYGFHAFSLMRRFFRVAENCVAVDQIREAMAIETALGAVETGKLEYAAKVLDPSRLPRMGRRLRPLMRTVRPRIRALDGALDRLLANGPQVEELDGFDDSFDDLFEAVAVGVACVPEKNAAFLRWRYGAACPQPPVTIVGAKEGGTLLGYAVLLARADDGSGYILDLTSRPGRRDVARALLAESVRVFAKAGAYIVRYRFTRSPTAPTRGDLVRLGFFSRGARRHTLLVRFADPVLHEVTSDVSNWSYAVGDGEASFWVK